MRFPRFLLAAGLILGYVGVLRGQEQPPSFSQQVRPFFARYCIECHNADKLKGGLSLEGFQALMQGGDKGPVVAAGKPNESRLVLQIEGKAKPIMPPKKARQPRPDEVALVRAWVAAGAKNDTSRAVAALPAIQPRVPVAAPVATLAYQPDGKVLAAGGHKEGILIDLASGDVIGRLSSDAGRVTALAYSANGRMLAIAAGQAGRSGEVRLYALASSGIAVQQPERVLAAHQDVIHDLAWSPDGRTLATCSYDRLIKLWDAATGQLRQTLKDHSDAVYGIAWSPDGRLLASAAADRAVKVWDVATGVRLYTLGESTDWLYAIAWSSDGRHLAAAGVDKSIRVWEVSAGGGRLVESVFAHEGPIARLAYSTDGSTLYSLGQDQVVKAWDAGRMVERKVYPRQPEAVLSLAVRPDHRQLALGRYDGRVVLLDEASGDLQMEPLPAKPKPPQLIRLVPATGPRGRPIRVTFEGKHLDGAMEVIASHTGVMARFVADGATQNQVSADLTFAAGTPAGVYQLSLKTPAGQTASLPFTVDLFPAVAEREPDDSPVTGQPVTLPTTLVGTIGRPGDVDFYRFEATAGQQIGVQVMAAAIGSKLDPVLELTDAAGTPLAESVTGVLGFTCDKAGIYAIGVRDREYRGGDLPYRLHVGAIPVVTAVFPLGLERGGEIEVQVEGVNLEGAQSVRIKPPTDAKAGTRLPISVPTSHGPALGEPFVVVGEFPEVQAVAKAAAPPSSIQSVPVPGTANGRITRPSATDLWRFHASKGKTLILEVNASRIGSALDSFLEVLDLQGRPVERARLRCLAKTYTTFRDHDSSGSGIRIETWSELAVNDYLLIGSELARIRELPRNPDDDCQFFSVAGRRIGYLDTTPTFHSMGTPMYKVAIHPPGTEFPANGLPVVPLFYHNDDGGPGYGKDSRLFFQAPADGDYLVRVGDSRGQGGIGYGYRLTIRPPQPSFQVSFQPTAPAVWKAGAVPISVTAERVDGFNGPIEVHLEQLPPGFAAPATTIPEGETSTAFALVASSTAVASSSGPPLKLVARAAIDGHEVVREVSGGHPRLAGLGDIATTTEQSEVTVAPGGQVQVTAKIERRHSFAGRVPLDVRGLPHGVRVLDIGLNGILITERDTSRTFVIYAEPWVQPTTHPFVVLARREAKGTEYAAPSVLLHVVPPHH
jgi:hypothetical protein